MQQTVSGCAAMVDATARKVTDLMPNEPKCPKGAGESWSSSAQVDIVLGGRSKIASNMVWQVEMGAVVGSQCCLHMRWVIHAERRYFVMQASKYWYSALVP